MRIRSHVAAVTVAVVAVAIGTTSGNASAAQAQPASPGVGKQAGRTVTLITGDRVTVSTGNHFSIQRANGREHMPFVGSVRNGHLNVVPVDALPLLRGGRLDPRLFDLTQQLTYRYDTRADLPLIVTSTVKAKAASRPAGLKVDLGLTAVHGLAGRAAPGDLATIWRDVKADSSRKVWLDGLRQPALDKSVPQIGAPQAWAQGYDGSGVTVALLDSGIDTAHPDLVGKVVAEHNFLADLEDGLDHVGHGTHVASTIAGTGAASGGKLKGVAPGAKLLDGKVCFASGCPESAILEGMQWAAAEQQAKIVSMSLGGTDFPGIDPLEQAVNDLSAQYGTLFVIAAGNTGTDRSVGSPGSADAALTVGAVDDQDTIAPFSSRGPRVGDVALKPDITAPGVNINAALSKDSGGPAGQRYIEYSGTSMATPHVAGAAAILLQRSPTLSGPSIKAALMASADPNPATGIFAQGAGRVDVPRSLATTLTSNPPSVSFGLQLFPHTDDTTVNKAVTYHNAAATDVTVSLVLQTGAAPAGTFSLGASTLTVPAGGDAQVTVTADTRVAGPNGFFGGYLVATAGEAVTRTPLAVEKESEKYELTVEHRDTAGLPTAQWSDLAIDASTFTIYDLGGDSPTSHVRLPKGDYVFNSVIIEDRGEDRFIAELQQPTLTFDKPTTVVVDARTAKPVTIKVPEPTAQPLAVSLVSSITAAAGWWVSAPSFDLVRLGAIGTSRRDNLATKLSAQLAQSAEDSPYQYHLAFLQRGRPFDGFSRTVRDRSLATVRSRYLDQVPGTVGHALAFSSAPDLDFDVAASTRLHLPATRIDYFNAGDFWWNNQLDESPPSDPNIQLTDTQSDRVTYQAGHSYRVNWNKAPFGPSYPPNDANISRTGDTIVAFLLLFGPTGPRAMGVSQAIYHAKLYRDGVLLDERSSPFIGLKVPSDEGRYRLEASASRGAPFTLSTQVTTAWEFRSGHADAAGPAVPLPIMAVRFEPQLSERGIAPAGRMFTVPVSVQSQIASSPGRLLEVKVSYDDGMTWRTAPVTRAGVVLHHPKAKGFVSLRAKAIDRGGNTVEQTVIRAYQLG